MPSRPFAIFSCDLDTVDRHLQGYGFDDLPVCDLIYRTAVPRLLKLFGELGIPAVLFVIARDADCQRPLWRAATDAGHEVACHSMTHPQPFSTLDDERLRHEITEARKRLTEACGAEVIGFRAPAWDVTERVLTVVAQGGYRYDASMFPTPLLVASRLAAQRRSTVKRSIFSMALLGHAFAPTVPHHPALATNGLVEFPIAVTRWLRLPVYHTFTYFVPPWLFARSLRSLLRSGRPVCYEFHAADLLDLTDDGVDPRMERHPGMRIPLGEKRAALRDIIATIARERQVVTYRRALESGLAS